MTGAEVWLPIEGWPGYQVSTRGRVRSVDRYDRAGRRRHGKVLKLSEHTGRGGLVCTLSDQPARRCQFYPVSYLRKQAESARTEGAA